MRLCKPLTIIGLQYRTMDTDAVCRSVSTDDPLEEGDGIAIDAIIAAILARLLASLCNDADREDECRTASEDEGMQLSSAHHQFAELQTANLRLQHQAKQACSGACLARKHDVCSASLTHHVHHRCSQHMRGPHRPRREALLPAERGTA